MEATVSGDTLINILTREADDLVERSDHVAIEEPLEIRVAGTDAVITMRTPGHDRELAAGLMLSEGLVKRREDFESLSELVDQPDVIQIVLKRFNDEKAGLLARSSLSNSACGVCGKKRLNLETMQDLSPLSQGLRMPKAALSALPRRLREHQSLFEHTGGLHAAALFNGEGELLAVREDVGRHNAVDKLNGWALLNDQLPLDDRIVLLSGRTSFELMQKCIMARVPIVCAISAPSSYAVSLARDFGVTLVGFLREDRFNVYSHPERILDL
ncbi:formate dehydrogenase accessory sulfurtransferase FdhD [Litchfieldella xinjiangensis]|uniref:formate dehydrogenase accessory sulfurtransferase FdhD n=1 Tax=Litchfieldella xinjiangensis TaxID=1166948 RepID=UPI00069427ED|nr:formate dehydrogenase accessory sulfurtransferase FdhD [Halomonas xinjiangensis]